LPLSLVDYEAVGKSTGIFSFFRLKWRKPSAAHRIWFSDEKKGCTMMPEAAFLVGGALAFLLCVTAFVVIARRRYFHLPSVFVVMTVAALGALISFFPPWVIIRMQTQETTAGPLYFRTETRLGHFSDPDAYLSALRRNLPEGHPSDHKEVNAGLLLAEYALLLSVATIVFLSVKARTK